MASFYPNQVRDSYISGKFNCGRSKSQLCLHKILRIISSFSPCETSKEPSSNPQVDDLETNSAAFCKSGRGFGVDLNLRLGALTETDESESLVVSTAEKSSEGENDPKEGGDLYGGEVAVIETNRNEEDSEAIEGKTTAEVSSGITDLQVPKQEEENYGEKLKGGDEGGKTMPFEGGNDCLALLIKAAELISSDDFGGDHVEESESGFPSQDDDKLSNELSNGSNEKTRQSDETEQTVVNDGIGSSGSKRKCWAVDLYGEIEEDTSPVVRSKRGRTQVLPFKYRDSVLDPWKRLSRPPRSSVVSAKRRSR